MTKYFLQAIQSLYGKDWQGAIFFDEDDNVSEVVPNEGCEQPVMEDVETEAQRLTTSLDTKNQIEALESSITDRRTREAILGIDNGWLKATNDKIATLRASL